MTSPETLELEAVDAALAGRYVAPEHAELAELALLLRDERPEPTLVWATHMDRRVEAGFHARPRQRPRLRLGTWWKPMARRWRRCIAPARRGGRAVQQPATDDIGRRRQRTPAWPRAATPGRRGGARPEPTTDRRRRAAAVTAPATVDRAGGAKSDAARTARSSAPRR